MKKILVIGYGNVSRSDDGAGVRAAESLEAQGIEGVEVRTMQQLHVDLVEDLKDYALVVLIDASEIETDVLLEKIEARDRAEIHSSHHLGPGVLASLSEELYGRVLNLYVCQVRGVDFDFGSDLSETTAAAVEEAVTQVTQIIKEFQDA